MCRAMFISMVTAKKGWRRWCGTREALIAAIETAQRLISENAGPEATADVVVTLKDGIEDDGGVEAIRALHEKELRKVRAVIVSVKVPFETWSEAAEEARVSGKPEPARPEERVSLRITQYVGASLEVEAENRVRAEGLRSNLRHSLEAGATNSPGFSRELFWAAGLLAVTPAMAGAVGIYHTIAGASPGTVEVGEVAALVVGGLLAASLLAALWWMFPPVELLAASNAGRFRRWRIRVGGVVAAIATGVVAAVIYGKL